MGNMAYIVLDDETLEVEDTKARTDIGDVTTLRTNAKDNLVKAVNECFQSASDGKALIASAITGKGVNTDSDATYAVMAENISSIQVGIDTSDATVTAGQMLSGSTAYARGTKVTGTMPNYLGQNIGNLQPNETYLDDGTPVTRLFLSWYMAIKRTSSTLTLIRIRLGTTGAVNGNTYVDVPVDNLSEGNIRSGVLIGYAGGNIGVKGTYTSDATATDTQILEGSIAYVRGNKVTGTMPNRKSGKFGWCGYDTVSVQPDPSASDQAQVTVPNTYNILGYYDRTSSVTANIANLNADNIKAGVLVGRYGGDSTNCITGTFTSDATATAAQILAGAIAYVNGSKVTGSMANQGAVTSALNAGGEYTIPAGYHNGSGKVTANSLASQTAGTATAAQILSGQVAYVNGTRLTGTMADNGAVAQSLTVNGSYTIPAGYHNGSGKVTQSLTTKAAATYTPGDTAQTIAAGQYLNGIQTIAAVPTETKTVTAGTAATTVNRTSGKYMTAVTVNPTPSQTKSVTLTSSPLTVLPDAGFLLSGVTVSADLGKKFATGTIIGHTKDTYKTFNAYVNGTVTSDIFRYFVLNCSFVPSVIVFTASIPEFPGYFRGMVSNNTPYGRDSVSYNGLAVQHGYTPVNYVTTIGTSTEVVLCTSFDVTTVDITWYAFG